MTSPYSLGEVMCFASESFLLRAFRSRVVKWFAEDVHFNMAFFLSDQKSCKILIAVITQFDLVI